METNVSREFFESDGKAMDRRLRSKPSGTALRVAEELIDHISYGLTRREQIREIGCIVDEAYSDLVRCAAQVVEQAERGGSRSEAIAELRGALNAHLPEQPADHGASVLTR